MSSDVYGKNVKRTLQFLNGDQKELIHELERAMLQHSETLEFEAAAAIRDQIKAIEKSLEKQNVLSTDLKDRDLIGLHRQGPTTQIYTLMIRAGRMQQSKSYFFPDLEIDTESLLEDFVHQYYLRAKMLPQEIILPLPLDLSTLTTVIKEQKGQHVAFHHPLRGSKVRLLEIVNKNAKQALTETLTRKSDNRDHLKQTQKLLKLKNLPERVECIDISHHQGDNIVGSCVCFLHGKPAKKLYKRYKIRSTSTQDDYKSIYEVVSRRLRRGLENSDLPTLLVIDGGKGQLKSAEAALIDHGVEDLELIALAKSRLKKEKGRQHYYSPERVFKCDMKDPIALPRHSTTTMLVTQIRDEAHRFAIEYQRMLARNKNRRSVLDDIPGIGPKRRNLLLKKFGSVKNLKERTKNEIETLLGPKLTQSLLAALRDLH